VDPVELLEQHRRRCGAKFVTGDGRVIGQYDDRTMATANEVVSRLIDAMVVAFGIWDTQVGRVELPIRKVREGSYYLDLLLASA